MTQPSNILILGAGELGTAVLQALAERRGASATPHLTVLLRDATINSSNPTKRAEVETLRALNVAFLPGDLARASVEELASLFAPFSTIVSCTGFAAGRGTQLKLARAVLVAGTKHYIPWQFGVDYDVLGRGSAQDLFDEQLDVRDLLRAQTCTSWTIVSTGIFTSFLFWPEFGVVDVTGEEPVVRALGSWENKVTATTAHDIGSLTAEVLLGSDAESHQNQVVHIAGDTISYDELARVVTEVKGREPRRELWDVPMLQQRLKEKPDEELAKYRVVFAQGKGVAWDKVNSLNGRRGITVTSVLEWARGNL